MAYELDDIIDEMDINPLVVKAKGKGAIAVDALVVPVRAS
jgi:hypothetical protein